MKTTLATIAGLLLLGSIGGLVYAHCQIPCGIFDDKTRIDLLYEDIRTIEKSMVKIKELSGKTDASDVNQVVRWVKNKEEHAEKIEKTATHYFMAQRIKPADGDGRERYLTQLTTLHSILIHAMKSKQTVDTEHCRHLRQLVDQFAAAYFSEEDLKHIREHHKHDH